MAARVNANTGAVATVMNLIALGINHNSAAVEVRERVAFAPEQVSEALVDACDAARWKRLLFSPPATAPSFMPLFPRVSPGRQGAAIDRLDGQLPPPVCQELRQCAYHFEAAQALQHLVQVASGLDSMVLGEPQIFGQLKSAYAVAAEAGTVGSELGACFRACSPLPSGCAPTRPLGKTRFRWPMPRWIWPDIFFRSEQVQCPAGGCR